MRTDTTPLHSQQEVQGHITPSLQRTTGETKTTPVNSMRVCEPRACGDGEERDAANVRPGLATRAAGPRRERPAERLGAFLRPAPPAAPGHLRAAPELQESRAGRTIGAAARTEQTGPGGAERAPPFAARPRRRQTSREVWGPKSEALAGTPRPPP